MALERELVRFCAPTLAGLKTGSVFSVGYESEEELRAAMRSLNRRLRGKGLRLLKSHEQLEAGEGDTFAPV